MGFEEMVMSKNPEFRQLQRLSVVTYGLFVGIFSEKVGQWFDIPFLPIVLMVLAGLATMLAYLKQEKTSSLMNRRESHENF